MHALSTRAEWSLVALHLQRFTCMPIMHMLTSSGAGTTAGWEAVERLRLAKNLEGATAERSTRPAAEGSGPTGGLEAAAAYEMR